MLKVHGPRDNGGMVWCCPCIGRKVQSAIISLVRNDAILGYKTHKETKLKMHTRSRSLIFSRQWVKASEMSRYAVKGEVRTRPGRPFVIRVRNSSSLSMWGVRLCFVNQRTNQPLYDNAYDEKQKEDESRKTYRVSWLENVRKVALTGCFP